jgi:hypothetical protein
LIAHDERPESSRDRPSRADGEGDPGTLPLRPGSRQCRCGKCGRYFWSAAAFDRHQRLDHAGNVICRNPVEFGMVQNGKGF